MELTACVCHIRRKAVRILLLCITSDETCLYFYVFVSGGVLSEAPLNQKGVQCCLVVLCHPSKPSTHGTNILSYCQALLYMLSDKMHYFREIQLFMYLFICFIFKCCCFVHLSPDYLFRCGTTWSWSKSSCFRRISISSLTCFHLKLVDTGVTFHSHTK